MKYFYVGRNCTLGWLVWLNWCRPADSFVWLSFGQLVFGKMTWSLINSVTTRDTSGEGIPVIRSSISIHWFIFFELLSCWPSLTHVTWAFELQRTWFWSASLRPTPLSAFAKSIAFTRWIWSLTTVHKLSSNERKISAREKSEPRLEPGTAKWKAQMLHRCYAAHSSKVHNSLSLTLN